MGDREWFINTTNLGISRKKLIYGKTKTAMGLRSLKVYVCNFFKQAFCYYSFLILKQVIIVDNYTAIDLPNYGDVWISIFVLLQTINYKMEAF